LPFAAQKYFINKENEHRSKPTFFIVCGYILFYDLFVNKRAVLFRWYFLVYNVLDVGWKDQKLCMTGRKTTVPFWPFILEGNFFYTNFALPGLKIDPVNNH